MSTVLVLAPYSPEGSPIAALGAARKIRGVLAALGSCFDEVALVNSAHNEKKRLPDAWSALQIGSKTISEYLPPRWHWRPIGKILNLLGVKSDVDTVLARIPRPDVIWIYNAYAYETLFLRELLRRGAEGEKPRIVLEIEDWPLARLRKGHPKPWLDWAGLRFALKRADVVFCVNEALESTVRRERLRVSVHVLPGLVDDAILKLHRECPPFQGDGPLRIGYFGGLSEEKGAGLLLEAIVASANRDWQWVVSGSGPMTERFIDCAKCLPNLTFHGTVNDEELVQLMGSCDVIVNPHRPISEMGDGVFPFKVVESVAMGRLVISTKLPPSGFSCVDAALCIFDGTVNGLVKSLEASRSVFEENELTIRNAVYQIQDCLSVNALGKAISKWIPQ